MCRFEEAEEGFRKLLVRNPENYNYHAGSDCMLDSQLQLAVTPKILARRFLR